MTLDQLEKMVPALLDYTRTMPEEIRRLARILDYQPGALIHQKDEELTHLGIMALGENRVINEFENGKVYMIETNPAIDFIGEVTILAEKKNTSVTIEAVTPCTIAYIPRKDAEQWIMKDPYILHKMAQHTARKLYRSSYTNGLKLYYPPAFLLADYLVQNYEETLKNTGTKNGGDTYILLKTRERLGEELGMNPKTLDRTIRSMQKDRYFHLTKGKITFGYDEYLKLKEYLDISRG